MNIKFKAFLLEMAESEIMDMVSSAQYMRIKSVDPHPVFRAYVVGHEGESRGQIASFGQKMGNVVKKWYRAAIKRLHDKIDVGLKLFHDHVDTNDKIGRGSIGEVVGKALKTINDKLSVVVAAYIQPQFQKLPLDIASIEADIWLTDKEGVYEADVETVSGIALGSSKTETPGFPGATLLGQIQAFAEKSQLSKTNFLGGNVEITISDVKAFIKAEGAKPGDLFSLADLTGDPSVKGFVESERKEAVAGEYAHRKRTDEKFDEEKKKWEEEKEKLEKNLKEKDGAIAKSKVGSLFEKIKEKRDFDERETKFLEGKLDDFTPQDIEKIDDELNKFVDDRVDEFNTLLKDVFEEDVDSDKDKDKDKDKDSITAPRKTKPGDKHPFDENPLIP